MSHLDDLYIQERFVFYGMLLTHAANGYSTVTTDDAVT